MTTAAVGLTLAIVLFDTWFGPPTISDFDQSWFAARALLEGRDPYVLVGPGREFDWPFAYYYPLTAPVLLAPLGHLPLLPAKLIFLGIPTTLLAWHLTRDGWERLPLFASGAWLLSVKWVQWSPAVCAAMVAPVLGAFAAAKPTLGLAALAGISTRRGLLQFAASMAALVILTQVLQPDWLPRWREALSTGNHFVAFLQYPEGLVLLALLARWRRAEARMVLVLSVVPLTPDVHSVLLLFLIPLTLRGITILGILSYVPIVFIHLRYEIGQATLEQISWGLGRATLWCVVLPVAALIMRRPNTGPVLPVMERLVSGLPVWLRGASGPAWDPTAGR